jgi:hypothetical protein
MKKFHQPKIKSTFGWVLGLGILAYFLIGFSIRIFLDIHNGEPRWLDSVVLTTIGGLFFCHLSLIGVLASIKQWARANRFDYKIGAVFLFLLYCMLPLSLGLFILSVAIGNLIELM